ncbi:MAG: oligosaccharide flippase family protein [Ardenticatenaceae bacterium]|nr:oligosaccharide flippase family protein [Ardenticatenaceae bacterium]
MINLRRLLAAARSATLRQGVGLMILTTAAYGFDYLFSLMAGRLLDIADFGILVALTGIGQILVVGSRIIQTVITRYVSELQARPDGAIWMRPFFRRSLSRMAALGVVVTAALVIVTPLTARFLNIDELAPVVAMMTFALLMATRPVVEGVLQGEQRFVSLGIIQVVQAVSRLVLGGWLMWIGWRAFGAVVALPIASTLAFAVGLSMLGGGYWKMGESPAWKIPDDLWRYAAVTGAGLGGYALLVNLDPILVKSLFDPVAAGNYGAALTLGKIVLFFPVAVNLIMFPKAAQMREEGRDPSRVLLPALGVVLLVCGGVTLAYFFLPDLIVALTVGRAYDVSGRLLGLMGLAMTFLSLVNVWLNYFLSLKLYGFTLIVWIGVVVQVLLIWFAAAELWHVPAILAANGLWLSIVGVIFFRWTR